MNKLIILFVVIFNYVPVYAPSKLDPAIDMLYKQMLRMIPIVESDNMHNKNGETVKGKSGEIGWYQIMPGTLGYVNKLGNMNIPLSSLTNKDVNQFVGEYYFYWLWYDKYPGDHVRAISGYNMGHNSKKVNTKYVKQYNKRLMSNYYLTHTVVLKSNQYEIFKEN